MATRDTFILVPGFGGFDALGSVTYYCGTTRVLRDVDGSVTVHYFPNLPAASVDERATALRRWLLRKLHVGHLRYTDRLHLIGHSTGGLDIRHLLVMLSQGIEADLALWRQVSSVQFVSVPHQGSWLATMVQPLGAQGVASLLLRLSDREGASGMRRLAPWLQRLATAHEDAGEPLTWVNAVLDAMELGVKPSATGKDADHELHKAYCTFHQWLLSLSRNDQALTDLHPKQCLNWTRAHERQEKIALRMGARDAISLRSIVTAAERRPGKTIYNNLFNLLYMLNMPRRSGWSPPLRLTRLLSPGRSRLVRPQDNDGLVGSLAQVWPSPELSCTVKADHGDIIGHYGGTAPCREDRGRPEWAKQPRSYDLLPSGTRFDEEKFRHIWRNIAEFALAGRGRSS